ncbi:hypothetical protein scyTo_0001225 [Scyliorhinus torazame]|uniref:Uncharacterized protein n=1 Tax=Scyliorhinus torazame TaxID=75743 RepID=A0A401PAU1_SCYTO|nr:hypothetical protein [Scyliorhinus torazame]
MPHVINSVQELTPVQSRSELAGKAALYPIISRNKDVISVKSEVFHQLKEECLRKGVLFEDEEFPANDSSLFCTKDMPFKLEWKRPPVSDMLFLTHHPVV